MKVPDSGQSPTPSDPPRAAKNEGSTVSSGARTEPALATGALLDRLELENRQAVMARVAQVVTNQKGQADSLLLELRGRNLLVQPAQGDAKLEPGDWIKVMRAGNELQLMSKLAPALESRIAQALAQRLPWQQRLDTGLGQLMIALSTGAKASNPIAPAQPLSAAAQAAIQQLFSRLPASDVFVPGITAQSSSAGGVGNTPGISRAALPGNLAGQVKAWIHESGLFAESRLARAPDAALPDLKLALTRIVTALLSQQNAGPEQFNRYTPLASHELVQAPLQFPNQLSPPPPASQTEPVTVGQMLRLLAGMLNRISVNQLHSQMLSNRGTADAPAPSTWLIELPWVTPQNEPRIAQLRLEHYTKGDSEENRHRKASPVAEWRFALALDLDAAGLVYFEVSLRELQVSARVWAEQQDTLRQVQTELTDLRTRLTELGLDVVDLECRRGNPQAATTKLEHRLVDTRA
ncbi:flagellar hook-length control protein FliK [Marinobacter changyiensis]|uniref:flagellar hook-length control protein FliK n=1 Tax=Marinobacter changyiensis TaxID=2604091 RepID=UPI00126582AB|nr:flagellar hook-length control protein FliK [Marinobacter changyiensis]